MATPSGRGFTSMADNSAVYSGMEHENAHRHNVTTLPSYSVTLHHDLSRTREREGERERERVD